MNSESIINTNMTNELLLKQHKNQLYLFHLKLAEIYQNYFTHLQGRENYEYDDLYHLRGHQMYIEYCMVSYERI